MNEKEMEDLIAEHPDEFFSSRKKLVFVSRQQSLDNAGRLDLRFQDEFKRTVVMELKAVPLTDAGTLHHVANPAFSHAAESVLPDGKSHKTVGLCNGSSCCNRT